MIECSNLNELEDFSGVELPQPFGNTAVVGRVSFPRYETPDAKYNKFGGQVDIPKGSGQAKLLFATVEAVARKKWGGEADEKLGKMAFAIANGFGGMDGSKVSIYDGDLVNQEYSAGCWQVKSSANEDQRPSVTYRGDDGVRYVATEPKHYPGNNDGVTVALEIWCQKDKDRVNLKVIGVVREVVGAGRPAPTPAQIAAKADSVLDQIPAPGQIPGVIPKELPSGQQNAQVPAQVPAQAAPERPAVYEPETRETAPPEGTQRASGPSLMDI
jgi:hypothetical protein